MREEHLLHGRGSGAGIERAAKDDEERVAFGTELLAAVCRERLALDGVVGQKGCRIVWSQLLDQPGRTLDVAEKEGDSPGRQTHAGAGAAARTGSRMACICRG